MVDLPRVPDERAGLCSRAGLLGGFGASINKCQQCRKQHSWGACSLLGRLGGGLGWEKNIFGYIPFNYNYYTHLHTSAGAGRDGLRRGHLDDVLLIVHVINWAPARSNRLLGLLGPDFNS